MNKRLFSIGIVLLAATLACSLAPLASPESVPNGDALGTAVAATLTALAPPGGDTATATPVDEASVPTVTPSELRVAYAKGGSIWLWTESGGARQLTTSTLDSLPQISSDGQVVVFVRNQKELWAVNADASAERLLVPESFFAALPLGPYDIGAGLAGFSMIPNTHRLFFDTTRISDPFIVHANDLYVVDADSPTATAVLSAGQGGVLIFSPSGAQAAIVRGGSIAVVNVDGGGLRDVLVFDNIMTYSEWTYYPPVAWLPDDSGLRVVIPAHDPLGNPSENSAFWNVPLSGSQAVLASFLAAPAFHSQPQIAPDGSRAAYMRENGGAFELHVVDAGGVDTMYTMFDADNFGLQPWSPDPTGFVYAVDNNIFLAHLSGAGVAVLDTPTGASLRWIDAGRVLYLTSGGELRLRVLGAPSVVLDSLVTEFSFDN